MELIRGRKINLDLPRATTEPTHGDNGGACVLGGRVRGFRRANVGVCPPIRHSCSRILPEGESNALKMLATLHRLSL